MKELSDLTAPAVIQKKPLLEAEIQKQCVDWARNNGWWCRKFSSLSQRSVPDYLFAKKLADGRELKVAVEFKKPGNKPTDAQWDEIEAMQLAGWNASWLDNFEEFRNWFTNMEKPRGWWVHEQA